MPNGFSAQQEIRFTLVAAAAMFRHALVVVLCLSSRAFAQSEILTGTPSDVRLTAPLSTQHSKKGAQVQAILAAPLLLGGRMLAPLGSAV